MNATSLYSLSPSLDDVEPHLSSLRWHRALPKDWRGEKWDKRAEREKEREGERGVREGMFRWISVNNEIFPVVGFFLTDCEI